MRGLDMAMRQPYSACQNAQLVSPRGLTCRIGMSCAGAGPASGPTAQGWGPLRVWPGGLCLSRAVGDFDVGPVVLAIPHIMQVCPLG